METESGTKQNPLNCRPATYWFLDLHSKFAGFATRFEIQTNPRPDLPHAQVLSGTRGRQPATHGRTGAAASATAARGQRGHP